MDLLRDPGRAVTASCPMAEVDPTELRHHSRAIQRLPLADQNVGWESSFRRCPRQNVPDDPLAAARATLQGVRWKAEQLLSAYSASRTSRVAPQNVAGQEIMGAIGGTLTREFFGTKRPGARYGKALAAANQRAARLRAEQEARAQALAMVEQARRAIETARTVLDPRTARSLLSNLANAATASRPETILRGVAGCANRLEAYRPSPRRESPEPDFPETLQRLEAGLRGCIASRLSKLAPDWWTSCVPADLRGQAERRKANRERVWPWLGGGDHPATDYLGFPDYAKIILEPTNWDRAFKEVFVDRDALRVKLHELEPLRTDIAHSRSLSAAHQARLEAYSADLLTAIAASGQ